MAMVPMVKVKGIAFAFNNEDTYVIPPIALGALEQLQQRITEFSGDVMDTKSVATVIDAAHAALKRNYPDLTREAVADLIDVENMADVFACVMDVSGVKRKAAEAGEVPGETTGN